MTSLHAGEERLHGKKEESMWGQCMRAQQRRGNAKEVAKWEKAAQKVGARAIKDTGEAGENVNT